MAEVEAYMSITSEKIMSLEYFLKLKPIEERKLFLMLWIDCEGNLDEFRNSVKNFIYLPKAKMEQATSGLSSVILRDQNKILNTIAYDSEKFISEMNRISAGLLSELQPKDKVSVSIETSTIDQMCRLLKLWMNSNHNLGEFRKAVEDYRYLPPEKRKLAKSYKSQSLFREQMNIIYVTNKYPLEFTNQMNYLVSKYGEQITSYLNESNSARKSPKNSLLNEMISSLANLAGWVMGGSIRAIGGITDSSLLKEIGDGVEQITKRTGRTLGKLSDGTLNVTTGLLYGDNERVETGFNEVGEVVKETLIHTGEGIIKTVENGLGLVDSIIENDPKAFKENLNDLIKKAVYVALPLSPIALIDLETGELPVITEELELPEVDNAMSFVNVDNNVIDSEDQYIEIENHNKHHVEPHPYHTPSGEVVIRGGEDGYEQTNPNYRRKI